MISVTGELIADETIQVRHIRRLSVIRIPEVYPPHRVRFANTSSTEIGDIDLRMFGGESIHIAVLPVAATTDFYELQQLAEGGGAMPPVSNGPSISLGDFEVRYIQGGAQKRIAIRRPSIEITIKFNDDSLSVE
jgi:hypothetical protein